MKRVRQLFRRSRNLRPHSRSVSRGRIRSRSRSQERASSNTPRSVSSERSLSTAASLERNPLTPPRHRSRHAITHPDALPCASFYNLYPERIGPTANVVVASEDEFYQLLLVGTRITIVEEEDRQPSAHRYSQRDVDQGGFCVYAAPAKDPVYFLIPDGNADVYSSATYVPALQEETNHVSYSCHIGEEG